MQLVRQGQEGRWTLHLCNMHARGDAEEREKMQHERMQKWDVVWDAQVGRSIDAQQAVVLRRRGGGKGVACGREEGLGGGQAVRWWGAAASRPSHLKTCLSPLLCSFQLSAP